MLKNIFGRMTLADAAMCTVGLALTGAIVAGSVATLSSGKYTLAQWQDLFIFGLAQGSSYALIALGYTLVYGVLRMINFAHSEVFLSGPYTAYFFARYLFHIGFLEAQPVAGLLIVSAISMFTSMAIALTVERVW